MDIDTMEKVIKLTNLFKQALVMKRLYCYRLIKNIFIDDKDDR